MRNLFPTSCHLSLLASLAFAGVPLASVADEPPAEEREQQQVQVQVVVDSQTEVHETTDEDGTTKRVELRMLQKPIVIGAGANAEAVKVETKDGSIIVTMPNGKTRTIKIPNAAEGAFHVIQMQDDGGDETTDREEGIEKEGAISWSWSIVGDSDAGDGSGMFSFNSNGGPEKMLLELKDAKIPEKFKKRLEESLRKIKFENFEMHAQDPASERVIMPLFRRVKHTPTSTGNATSPLAKTSWSRSST